MRRTHCIRGHELSDDAVYRRKNGTKRCLQCTKEYDRRPDRKRMAVEKYIMKRYKLSPDAYQELLGQQDHKCSICKTPLAGGSKRPAIDHDHKCCPSKRECCGKCIRGVLCIHCNLGLGYFRDDPEVLSAAVRYLTTTAVAA